MAKLRQVIEDLLKAVLALQGQDLWGGKMEIPKGNPNPLEIPESCLEDKLDDGIGENPYHDTRPVYNPVRGGLKGRLAHALALNGEGIKIVVFGKILVEDYLD